jgi:hypothetical protein
MKRRGDKKSLMKVLFIALVVLAVGIIGATYYTPAVDAATWVVNTHEFFLDLNTNIGADISVIAFVGGAIALGYYFLVYKPRLRK